MTKLKPTNLKANDFIALGKKLHNNTAVRGTPIRLRNQNQSVEPPSNLQETTIDYERIGNIIHKQNLSKKD